MLRRVFLSFLFLVPLVALGQGPPIAVKGDVENITVVNSLPVTLSVPDGLIPLGWSATPGVTIVDNGLSCDVTAAPPGKSTVTFKGLNVKVTFDPDQKKQPVVDIQRPVSTFTFTNGIPQPLPPGPPNPPTPPTPTGTMADFVVGIVDNNARTLEQAGILMDGSLLAWLNANKVDFRVVSKDAAEFRDGRYAKDLADAKATAPAAIRYLKGKVLEVVSAANVPNSDAVKLFVQGNLGANKVTYDPQAESLVYHTDDGTKRMLTRLPADKAALVPLKKAIRFGDVKTLVPRSQWREINRRDDLPAGEWILNQGQVGSCVGNGSTDALRKVRFFTGMTDLKLSPGCTYAQINGGRDNGAVIGDSMTALTQTGTVRYSTVGESPYYLSQLPAGWQTEAKRFRIEEAYVTPTFDEMASALQLGYVLVHGVMVGNNFGRFTTEGVCGVDRGYGNHCVHSDGMHKLSNGSWAFDMANSWGETWGPFRNGRAYVTESHFTNGLDCSDFYAIKAATLDPQDPKTPKVSVPEPPGGWSKAPPEPRAFWTRDFSALPTPATGMRWDGPRRCSREYGCEYVEVPLRP